MNRHRPAVAILASVLVSLALGACTFLPPPESAPTPAPETTVAPPTTTPPTTAASSTAVGMLVWGDAGTGTTTQTEVATQMSQWAAGHRVDALLEVGDVVYDVGDPSLFASRIDAPYASLSATRPFWIALGNHDVATADGDEMLDHMGLPGHWYEKVLSRNGVSVQLLVLDSNHVSDVQTNWLDERLSSGSHTWRIVAFHHPAYSCGSHGSTADVVARWVPVLERHRVDLVVSGHDHSYQRFQDGATTYIVTGGGGASLTGVTACASGAALESSAQRHHFLGIEASTGGLTVSAIARTGETLDSVTLH